MNADREKTRHVSTAAGQRTARFLFETGNRPGQQHEVQIKQTAEQSFTVDVDDHPPVEVEILRFDASGSGHRPDGRLCLSVDGDLYDMTASWTENNTLGLLSGGIYREIRTSRRNKSAAQTTPDKAQSGDSDWRALTAPMPAVVTEVLITPGSVVGSGQPVIRLEAMKMVITLSAPRQCIVDIVLTSANKTVAGGELLVRFRPEAAPQ